MQKLTILFITALFLSGCQKYYISIAQEKVDKSYLASVALKTPDPRKDNPPLGEKLIVEWTVPREYLAKKPSLHLHVIYKDYTEAFFSYPMPYKMDYVVYSLLGEEYKQKKGVLTYQAEVRVGEEKPFLDWKHQLWTKLIVIEDHDQPQEQSEEDNFSLTSKINSSVSDQPIQGSVRDSDGLTEEELKD
jgi:hypothetical protein